MSSVLRLLAQNTPLSLECLPKYNKIALYQNYIEYFEILLINVCLENVITNYIHKFKIVSPSLFMLLYVDPLIMFASHLLQKKLLLPPNSTVNPSSCYSRSVILQTVLHCNCVTYEELCIVFRWPSLVA